MTSVNRHRVFQSGAATALTIVIAANLSAAPAEEIVSTSVSCPSTKAFTDPLSGPHWNGWGVDLSQRRFQPADMAQLAAEDVPKLKLAWAFGFDSVNRAYAQPTIVGARLFIGSANGKVYSLDAKTGCIIWTFEASAPVRTAISIGIDARGWSAYFGDQRANAYALDALSGKLHWKVRIDEHPAAIITGAPTLVEPVLYVPVTSYEEATGADLHYPCCSFRGSIAALDTVTGKVLWKSFSIAELPKPVRTNCLTYRATTNDAGKMIRRYWTSACRGCALKSKCTPEATRRVSRWEHEAVLETVQARLDHHPEKMTIRRQTAEHPFGTIKCWMGATHFLTKRLPKVATEMALNVLAYNIKRVMALIGVAGLLEALAT